MQLTHTKTLLAALTATACVGMADAGTIVSSEFNGVTDAAVSTSSALDWGYFSNDGGTFDGVYNAVPFGSLTNSGGTIITTVSGASQIGAVTLTENDGVNDAISAQTNDANFTFDANASFGSYGGFAPNEPDIWTIKLNDLGVGTFTVTLYMGHSDNNRVFDVDYTLDDGGDVDSGTTTSPGIGTLGSTVTAYGTSGSSFTYDIVVTTTDPTADLTLTFGGVSGGFGGGIFAGYTVVPEPGSLALLGLGGLLIGTRRRRA